MRSHLAESQNVEEEQTTNVLRQQWKTERKLDIFSFRFQVSSFRFIVLERN